MKQTEDWLKVMLCEGKERERERERDRDRANLMRK